MPNRSSRTSIRQIAPVLATALVTIFALLLGASASFAQGGEIDRPGQGPGEIIRPGQPDKPDVANRDNPYDDVGRLHNEMLDYVIGARHKVGDRPAPLATAAIGRALEFAQAELHGPCAIRLVDFDDIARIVVDPNQTANEILGKSLSREQYEYVLKIDEISSKMVENPRAVEEMRALEAEIDDVLSADDAAPLLAGASVARYSYEYWSKQIELGEASPWLEGTGTGTGGTEKLKDWLKADLKGAIKGMGSALVSGGGVIVGGLVGGGVASAIHLIDKL